MAFNPEKYYPESEYRKKKRAEEKINKSRRNFLRLGVGIGAALVAGRLVNNCLTSKKESESSPEKDYAANKIKNLEKESAQAGYANEEETELDMEYAESVADILDFDKEGPMKLNPEKMDKVKNYWKQRYASLDPKLHKSLVDGYREWGCWRPYTEHGFKSAGIPIRYALLALPESHWKVHARSKADAVGPYQFTPDTARRFNLKMNRTTDERKCPIKSAEACARTLKELYLASGDWKVALSGYNGSFAWRFIKEAKKNGQKTDYSNFLEYLEKKLNKIRDDLYTDGKFSNLSHATKRKIFARKISGFCENLNYPPKFYAIEELIKEGKIREQQPPIKFREEKIIQTTTEPRRFEHVVAKGETLFKIARKINISPRELYKYNRKLSNLKKLKPGDRLEIPLAKKIRKECLPGSLMFEAKKRGKSEKEVRFLNPHILDVQAPLSLGTVFRI